MAAKTEEVLYPFVRSCVAPSKEETNQPTNDQPCNHSFRFAPSFSIPDMGGVGARKEEEKKEK